MFEGSSCLILEGLPRTGNGCFTYPTKFLLKQPQIKIAIFHGAWLWHWPVGGTCFSIALFYISEVTRKQVIVLSRKKFGIQFSSSLYVLFPWFFKHTKLLVFSFAETDSIPILDANPFSVSVWYWSNNMIYRLIFLPSRLYVFRHDEVELYSHSLILGKAHKVVNFSIKVTAAKIFNFGHQNSSELFSIPNAWGPL